MMSLEAINALSHEASVKAAESNQTPYVPYNADEVAEYGLSKPFPFPDLGDHVPEGWERLEDDEWFVDHSGFGEEGEPALTQEQFRVTLKEYLEHSDGVIGLAITECGQFQLYVSAYRKV